MSDFERANARDLERRERENLTTDPFAAREEAIGRELRGRALSEALSELPVLESMVLRLQAGVPGDEPLEPRLVAAAFRDNTYRANRVSVLQNMRHADLQSPFDRAILFLLGHRPLEHPYSFEEIAEAFDLSPDLVRLIHSNALAHVREKLRGRANLED